jgi:hypothetical protein
VSAEALKQREMDIENLKADKYESMKSYKKAAVLEIESIMDKLLEKNKQVEVIFNRKIFSEKFIRALKSFKSIAY